MRHVVANITWNSWGWRRPTTEADRRLSGHGNVRGGYVGNESWNFAFDRHVEGDHKYGSFEGADRARQYSNGEGIVFFWSKGLLVGLYARAELLRHPVLSLDEVRQFNVRVPVDPKWLIQPFVVPITAKVERHLRDGSGFKKRPGQTGFCYIDDVAAANIVCDAIDMRNTALKTVKDKYGF